MERSLLLRQARHLALVVAGRTVRVPQGPFLQGLRRGPWLGLAGSAGATFFLFLVCDHWADLSSCDCPIVDLARP